jgi:protein-S-isoprenylcysteine O-methyltransferase
MDFQIEHLQYNFWIATGLYIFFLIFFHISEYTIVAIYNPDQLSFDSWLFQRDYVIAMVLSALEHALEWVYLPILKGWIFITALGIFLVILGETIRKTGMITAKVAFTHAIQEGKRDEHKLVTDGIYSCVRHPGYLGWFIWTIGMQVLIANPICTVLFTCISWYFFYYRIRYEEISLVEFFGEDYRQYRKKVPSGLPCII